MLQSRVFTVMKLTYNGDFFEGGSFDSLDDAQAEVDEIGEMEAYIKRDDGMTLNAFGEWIIVTH